jgi:hypothetical protein
MAKRIIRLTEADLVRLVKKVVNEQFDDMDDDESEPCIYCGGSGYDYDNDHECEWCDGTGVHDELHIHKDDVYPKTKWSYPKNMDEQSKEGEEHSDEETKKLVDYFWNSMTTGEKRKLMTKVDKERKEKGLPSLRPKSSRIMKKDK